MKTKRKTEIEHLKDEVASLKFSRREWHSKAQDKIVECERLEARIAAIEERLEPVGLARRFHEAYERLAPEYRYETRPESAVPWDEVPEPNRSLMVAVATVILHETLDRPKPELRCPTCGRKREEYWAHIGGIDRCEDEFHTRDPRS